MPIDYTTDIGRVRLLTADLDDANPIMGDDQIEAYLEMNGQSLNRAAADILDAIATSEVLVSKVIRTQDLSTDGSKVAADLRGRANALRAKADIADENDGSFFEIIPNTYCKPEGAEARYGW